MNHASKPAIASTRGYAYPRVLAMAGLLAWFITLYLGWASLGKLAPLLY